MKNLFASLCLMFSALGAHAMSSEDFQSYSSSDEVRTMISSAMRHRRPRPTGNCYHYVKEAIYEGALAPSSSLTGGYARLAIQDLEGQGFQNIAEDLKNELQDESLIPKNAPIGAILVFDGDRYYRAGDVAIKMETGYVSDYYSPRPITEQWNGAHFRLVGVMVKADFTSSSDGSVRRADTNSYSSPTYGGGSSYAGRSSSSPSSSMSRTNSSGSVHRNRGTRSYQSVSHNSNPYSYENLGSSSVPTTNPNPYAYSNTDSNSYPESNTPTAEDSAEVSQYRY